MTEKNRSPPRGGDGSGAAKVVQYECVYIKITVQKKAVPRDTKLKRRDTRLAQSGAMAAAAAAAAGLIPVVGAIALPSVPALASGLEGGAHRTEGYPATPPPRKKTRGNAQGLYGGRKFGWSLRRYRRIYKTCGNSAEIMWSVCMQKKPWKKTEGGNHKRYDRHHYPASTNADKAEGL